MIPSSKIMNRGKEAGFTLLEVLVAISILSVGILGVASMQASAIRGNDFAGGLTEGTTWAGDRMEKLVERGLANFNDSQLSDTDGDGDAGLEDAATTTADHQESQGRYTLFWNVSRDSLLNGTKTVNIIVTWTYHGAQKRVSLQNVIPEIT